MKLIFIGLVMTFTFSAYAGNRTVFPTSELASDGSRIDKTLIVSEERFNNREDAKIFCQGIQAELAPLVNILVSSMDPNGMTTKESKKYVFFNFSKLTLKNSSEKLSGIIGWADDKTYIEDKTPDGKNPEVIMMINGKGAEEDMLTVEELNSGLSFVGGKVLKIHAICIK
jgi:hypothetical protein